VLASATGDIEIIPVIDGYKPNPPLKFDDHRIKPIYLDKAIGQRAAYNLGVKHSTGEYVMKLDAHAMTSEGFDEVLQSHCPEDAVVLPIMKRLDVNKWEPKNRGKTKFMYFGLDVFCHYWRAYEKRAAAKVKYPEVLTGQGSCWFTTRKWNDYIGLLDEGLGSWGKVGIEISLKTWLCGGIQILNPDAWQAHWFRAGEGRFPYPLDGRQLGRAKDITYKNFFAEKAFPNQVRSFKWLMDKFAPVPGWEAYMVDEYKTPRTIIYYTDSKLERTLADAVRRNLAEVSGPIPIISVSQKPLRFGDNICVGEKPRSTQSMYEQILIGAEAAPEGSIIYLCEHDVFYHSSHFAKLPKDKGAFYFNTNRYYWRPGMAGFFPAPGNKAFSQAVASREYVIAHCKKRLADWGPLKVRNFQWKSERPNVDVRHGQNLTGDGKYKQDYFNGKRKLITNLGGWGGPGHFQSKVKYKGTMRWDILQELINLYGYESYLEIGIDKAQNWNRIDCKLKHGTDPNSSKGTHTLTSDEFFRRFYDTYDLIFIDGLHHAEQVEKDIDNALDHLNEGGTIVMHDCSPRSEEEQTVPQPKGARIWTGDCWKAFVKNRTRPDLEMYTVDTNNGLGIIRPGKQETIKVNGNLDFPHLKVNREEWLNLKSVMWFRKYEKKRAGIQDLSG